MTRMSNDEHDASGGLLNGVAHCDCEHGPTWSGSPNPANPDNEWLCDECGRVISAGEIYAEPADASNARIADRVDGYDRDDLGESPDY